MASPLPHRLSEPGAAPSSLRLVACLAALLVLTFASWGIAQLPIGVLHTPAALLIAAIKAGLVAAIFMELSHGTTSQRAVLVVTVVFIALLSTGMVADVAFR